MNDEISFFEADKSPIEPNSGNELNLVGGEYNFDFTPGKIPEAKLKPMLFVADSYYPLGGWKDFKGFFNSIDEAKEYANYNLRENYDAWAQIVIEGKIVVMGILTDGGEWEFEDVVDGI